MIASFKSQILNCKLSKANNLTAQKLILKH